MFLKISDNVSICLYMSISFATLLRYTHWLYNDTL